MCPAELCLPVRPFGYALSCCIVMQYATLVKTLGKGCRVQFITAVPGRKVFSRGQQVTFAIVTLCMGQHEIMAQIEGVA